MNPRGTPANLITGDPNRISADERSAIIAMAASRARYVDMASALGRHLGTIKTTMFHLRNAGLVARRLRHYD